MAWSDQRSFRVALVADAYVNPSPGTLDAIAVLLETDWGAIQLPAESYPHEVAARLLGQVAEQTEEFHRRGYDVVVIGNREGLPEALAAVGVLLPDHIDPATATELRDFLRRRKTRRGARQSAHAKRIMGPRPPGDGKGREGRNDG